MYSKTILNLASKILILLFSVVLISSCANDDDGVGPDAGSGTLSAKVDGADFDSKDEVDGAVFLSSQGSNIIQAYTVDNAYISLTIFGSLSSGFSADTDNGIFQAQYRPDFNDSAVTFQTVGGLGSGTITITSYSNSNITGTFLFTGVKVNSDGSMDEAEVTQGTFDIDY